jgi:hypothetical protein
MADDVKKKAATGIAKKTLDKLVKDVDSAKTRASEQNGVAGQIIKVAVEEQGVSKKAFAMMMGLRKKDESERQAIIRAFLDYSHKQAFFDSVDAFDDVLDVMKRIISEVEARKHNGVDPSVDAVLPTDA